MRTGTQKRHQEGRLFIINTWKQEGDPRWKNAGTLSTNDRKENELQGTPGTFEQTKARKKEEENRTRRRWVGRVPAKDHQVQ